MTGMIQFYLSFKSFAYMLACAIKIGMYLFYKFEKFFILTKFKFDYLWHVLECLIIFILSKKLCSKKAYQNYFSKFSS